MRYTIVLVWDGEELPQPWREQSSTAEDGENIVREIASRTRAQGTVELRAILEHDDEGLLMGVSEAELLEAFVSAAAQTVVFRKMAGLKIDEQALRKLRDRRKKGP